MQILYIPNNSSAIGDLPFMNWFYVWATTGELRPQNSLPGRKIVLFKHFFVHIPATDNSQAMAGHGQAMPRVSVRYTMNLLPTNSVCLKVWLSFFYLPCLLEDHLHV